MRLTLTVVCALALVVSFVGCGSGTSDNTLTTGTTPLGTGRATLPPGTIPTPAVARQAAVVGMTDRELAFMSELFEKVNDYRGSIGLAAVLWDVDVCAVAQAHTVDMLTNQVITHGGPAGCLENSTGRCLKARLTGIPFIEAGENLAAGFPGGSPAYPSPTTEVLDAWIASPDHFAILTDAKWTHVGYGFKEGAGGPWWAQVFIQR